MTSLSANSFKINLVLLAKLFFAGVLLSSHICDANPATTSKSLKKHEEIIIGADPWCPYTCFDKKDHPGYMIEIAKEIFAKHNIIVTPMNINWARAIKQAELGKLNAIAGASQADAPTFIYPNASLGKSGTCFYKSASNPWNFTSIASLKDITLGIVHGYAYVAKLDKYFLKNKDTDAVQAVTGEEAIAINFKKILAGRIQATVMDDAVATYTLASMRLNTKIVQAGCTTSDQVYIAFSPVAFASQKYAKILGDGIIQLRKRGRLKQILAKYNLKDWQ